MKVEEFRELISRPEGPTLDYKRELYLDKIPRTPDEQKIVGGLDNKRRAELAKDVMSLANAHSHWESLRYLIIGVDDNGQLVGIEPGTIDEQRIKEAIKTYCEPAVDCRYAEIQVEGLWCGLITIPDSPLKPHKFSSDVHYEIEKRTRRGTKKTSVFGYHKDDVWVRRLSHSEKASPEEIIQLAKEAEALSGGEIALIAPPSSLAPDSLDEILYNEAPELLNKMRMIRSRAEELYISKLSPPLYVGDPEEHYQKINSMLNASIPLAVKQAMSPEEIFVLLCSVFLHEVGMAIGGEGDDEVIKSIQETQQYRTQQIILQQYEILGLTRLEAYVIGYLCYGHRKENILEIPEERLVGTSLQPVRVQFLTALIRFAHVLDLNRKLALMSSYEDEAYWRSAGALVAINPITWEIRVEAMPRNAKEEGLIRRVAESAQKELDKLKIFLQRYGLRYHTIRVDIHQEVYELPKAKPLGVINPYKCLAAFTGNDADIFFGRDEEIDTLLGKVCSYDIVTLLGESGVGKTSLLRAGLTPKLEALGYEVIYARCYDDPEERIREAVYRDIEKIKSTDVGSFTELMIALSTLGTRIVVLLDQAEELFTRVSNEIRRRFILDMANLITDRKFSVKFAFCLRDDYAHRLFDVSRDIPALYQREYTCRLTRLNERAVRSALTRPAEEMQITIEGEVVESVLNELQVDGLYYPPDIQIVGYQLFEERDKKKKGIGVREYETLGGARRIVSNYFFSLIEDYPLPQKELAMNILKLLVTSYETKNQFTLEEICQELQQPGSELLQILEQLIVDRLVNRIPGNKYELVHDYLAAQIQQRWVSEEELGLKQMKEMLRLWLREWQELGKEGLGHLLDVHRLESLGKYADRLRPNVKELELIITSALRYGTEVGPWLRQLNTERAIEVLAQLQEAPRADMRARATRALAMTRSEDAISYLARAVKDENDEVREEAIEGLGYVGSEKVVEPLVHQLPVERSSKLRIRIIDELVHLGTKRAIEVVFRASMKDRDGRVRYKARRVLGDIGGETMLDPLMEVLGDEDVTLREGVVLYLKQFRPDAIVPKLVQALEHENSRVREGAISILAQLSGVRVTEPMIRVALEDQSVGIRREAIRTLGQDNSKESIRALVQICLNGELIDLREQAAKSLVRIGSEEAETIIGKQSIESEDPLMRERAAIALRYMGTKRSLTYLKEMLKSDNASWSERAAIALSSMRMDEAIEILAEMLREEDTAIRNRAIHALRQSGTSKAMRILVEAGLLAPMKPETAKQRFARIMAKIRSAESAGQLADLALDEDEEIRKAVASTLAKIRSEESVNLLYILLEDKDEVVSNTAANALATVWEVKEIKRLAESLKEKSPTIRKAIAKALSRLEPKEAVVYLVTLLEDENIAVRRYALQAIGEVESAVDHLKALLESDDEVMRQMAANVLTRLRIPISSAVERELNLPDYTEQEIVARVLSGTAAVRRRARKIIKYYASYKVIDSLISVIDSADDTVCGRAVRALGALVSSELDPILLQLLRGDEVISRLRSLLERDSYLLRQNAVKTLSLIGGAKAADIILGALDDDAVAQTTIAALVRIEVVPPKEAMMHFFELAKSSRLYVAQSLANLIGKQKLEEYLDYLIVLSKHESIGPRQAAASALGELGTEDAIECLIAMKDDDSPAVRQTVANSFGRIGTEAAIEHLADLAKDRDAEVRQTAASSFGRIGSEKALRQLNLLLKDTDEAVRQKAAQVLKEISDEIHLADPSEIEA